MAVNGKTADLAKLLRRECKRLLKLYTERESLPSLPVSGEQLVSIPPLTPQISSSDKLCFLSAALRACLRLLEDVIPREDAEFPDLEEEEEEDEYRKQRKSVRDHLRNLVMSMERHLQEGKRCEATVAKVPDSVDSGAFALKTWILQVLQDLVHWTSMTVATLQPLSSRTSAPRRMRMRSSRGTAGYMKGLRK